MTGSARIVTAGYACATRPVVPAFLAPRHDRRRAGSMLPCARSILTDGGMGQELLRRSQTPPTPLWSGRVLIDEPEPGARSARRVHPRGRARDHGQLLRGHARAAGARGRGELFEPLQKRALDLAHEAREAAGEGWWVLHRRLPLAALRQLPPGADDLVRRHARRSTGAIVAQQADRVDLMLCETMASAEEARAAAIAAAEGGKPVWVSWTLADDGPPRLRSGETLATAADSAGGHPARPRASSTAAVRRPSRRPAGARRARRAGRCLRQRLHRRRQLEARRHRSTCSTRATISALPPTRTSRWAGSRPARRSSAAAAKSAPSTSPCCATGSAAPAPDPAVTRRRAGAARAPSTAAPRAPGRRRRARPARPHRGRRGDPCACARSR